MPAGAFSLEAKGETPKRHMPHVGRLRCRVHLRFRFLSPVGRLAASGMVRRIGEFRRLGGCRSFHFPCSFQRRIALCCGNGSDKARTLLDSGLQRAELRTVSGPQRQPAGRPWVYPLRKGRGKLGNAGSNPAAGSAFAADDSAARTTPRRMTTMNDPRNE